MSTFILIGIDPFAQPGLDYINKFNSLKDVYTYLENWIDYKLEDQKRLICGLRGNKKTHINKYLDYIKQYNYIHFYGEFTIESREPYEYKWILSIL